MEAAATAAPQCSWPNHSKAQLLRHGRASIISAEHESPALHQPLTSLDEKVSTMPAQKDWPTQAEDILGHGSHTCAGRPCKPAHRDCSSLHHHILGSKQYSACSALTSSASMAGKQDDMDCAALLGNTKPASCPSPLPVKLLVVQAWASIMLHQL